RSVPRGNTNVGTGTLARFPARASFRDCGSGGVEGDRRLRLQRAKDVVDGLRTAHDIALNLAASRRPDQLELLARLDAFGDRRDVEHARERHDGLYDAERDLIAVGQVVDERPVNL